MTTTTPVILLAFANDPQHPLPRLVEEADALRRTLEQPDVRRVCEAIVREHASLQQVADVFTDWRFAGDAGDNGGGRIVVFHYGGHANDYQLRLEASAHADLQTSSGAANGAAFARYLGLRKALHLVFLNGCATRSHAQALLDAGVRVVIATSQSVRDDVARDFATYFYRALAKAYSIQRAFDEARNLIEAGEADGNRRNLLSTDLLPEVADQIVPWELHISPRHPDAADWGLAEAADDPFLGLPPLPPMDLPKGSPYRRLEWYGEEHAPVFFGRGWDTRRLYDRVTNPHSEPVIFLYGQTGVGKSSIVSAGLVPRLRARDALAPAPRSLRRDKELGLAGTLRSAIGARDDGQAHVRWRQLEETGPLVLILDQVEEAFTRQGPVGPYVEMAALMSLINEVFSSPATRPKGKLILSFRKEWLAELNRAADEQGIGHSDFLVQRLDAKRIVEVICGPADQPLLKERYGLTVEQGVAETIAAELTRDADAPVAPMLQVLLHRLWLAATELDQAAPCFSMALYEPMRHRLGLDAFLEDQLKAMQLGQHADVVTSGMALDLLERHTTSIGTAEQCSLTSLQETYPLHASTLLGLTQDLKDRYVLVDPRGMAVHQSHASRLAHDTLAPLVRERFATSGATGQRARRILENRGMEWQGGTQGHTLDESDLAIVEAGAIGMRAWSEDETRLVQASREEKRHRHAEAIRVSDELEKARRQQIERVQERARQRTRIIYVLSLILGVVLAWRGLLVYRDWYFASSAWQPIAGDNFPRESVAYKIAVARTRNHGSSNVYCVATWMVGIGCSRNGETWNFYQDGLPTGDSAPTDIGGHSGNMRGITALAFDEQNSDVLYAFANDHHFYRSDNAGQLWIPSEDSLPSNLAVSSLIANDKLVIAVARDENNDAIGHMYVSSDHGQHWRLEAASHDGGMTEIFDVRTDLKQGGILVATSNGLMRGRLDNESWNWLPVAQKGDTRLLAPLPWQSLGWATVTFEPNQGISRLCLGPVEALQCIAQWNGEPLGLTLDPPVNSDDGLATPSAYVLQKNGDVVRILTTGQVQRIKGLSHPLFGYSYDIAAVPGPENSGSWLLLGHRKGLMRYHFDTQATVYQRINTTSSAGPSHKGD